MRFTLLFCKDCGVCGPIVFWFLIVVGKKLCVKSNKKLVKIEKYHDAHEKTNKKW